LTLRPAPAPPRKERTHVEFPGATWTAFDRYARYGAIVRALRANVGGGKHVVLDVGDNSGWLMVFDDELVPISVDVERNMDALIGTCAVLGDGTHLPVRDRSVDVAVSSDALEHVPPDARDGFLRELGRVSDTVIVAAPFDTPGVAGAEEFVRRFVLSMTGAVQDQLDEHAAHGLPVLDDAVGSLRGAGLEVAVIGNGNLQDWLLGMLLKHQLAITPVLDDVSEGMDVLYNMMLAQRNELPPFYRHVLIACRERAPIDPTPVPVPGHEAMASDVVHLALVAATLDITTRHTVWQSTQGLYEREREVAEHLMARFTGVESSLAELRAATAETHSQLADIADLFRHPMRAVGRRVRRRDGSSE
jgi:hypothetical protein